MIPPEVARIIGFRVRADRWTASVRAGIAHLDALEHPTDAEKSRLVQLLSYARPVRDAAWCGKRTPMNWIQQPTGRWSTAKPNLHAITKSYNLRDAVVPGKGMVFVRGDWRSAHLIIAAGLSNDRDLQRDLEFGDAYSLAMSMLAPELGSDGRTAAKVLILSALNGAGPDKLAEILVAHGVMVDASEAENRRCRWMMRYPRLSSFMREVVRDRSWRTPLGRTVSLPDRSEDYYGLGWRWQSYEADAMTLVLHELMVNRPEWLVAFVCYDEILLETLPAEQDLAKRTLQRFMDESLRQVSSLSVGNPDNTTKVASQMTWSST